MMARHLGCAANPKIVALGVLLLLAGQGAFLTLHAKADEVKKPVKMDDKTVLIPELVLSKKATPVTDFLYIGSWEGGPKAKNARESLFEADTENHRMLLRYPEKLLENSRPRLIIKNNQDVLDRIPWGRQQATHIAFRVMSNKRQPAVVEAYADSDVMLFHNGKLTGSVTANTVLSWEGRAYLPVMLEAGENNISIKQFSSGGKPQMQMTVYLDRSHDLPAAWQPRGGFLKKILYMPGEHDTGAALDWGPNLGDFSVSLEVRDVAADKIVFRNESVPRGRAISDEVASLAPGVYEAIYRAENEEESISEFFVIGDPEKIFEELQGRLSKVRGASLLPSSNGMGSKDAPPNLGGLDARGPGFEIEALVRRGQILLAKNNYSIFDREWQEKIAYTLGSLAVINRMLEEGVANVAKDQPGLHIRGFASEADGSTQFYRLFVPTTYKAGALLPLLVMVAPRITVKERPFIEGPNMAGHRDALLWAKYAEKYGFAILWPGYRNAPEGYTYEAVHINEAIRAVERNYDIDKHRISLYGSCAAGYNAGRLASEYNNRFAAIVYDRAVFDRTLTKIESSPSLMTWYQTINPSRHVIENRNLKIFVMHDGSRNPGHGEIELTTHFLEQANKVRNDVVQSMDKLPAGITRMDKVFSWLASGRNENPDDTRSHFLPKAGYIGPIMEIFATPFIVVEGTRGTDFGLGSMQNVIKSMTTGYKQYFHGAECPVKKDHEVNEDDIKSHSLILVGNPQSNSVWAKLEPHIPLKVTPSKILRGNGTLTDNSAFMAIERHPFAVDKYVLMIGALELRYLRRVTTSNLYNAWYDGIVFSVPSKIISKLDDMGDSGRANRPGEPLQFTGSIGGCQTIASLDNAPPKEPAN